MNMIKNSDPWLIVPGRGQFLKPPFQSQASEINFKEDEAQDAFALWWSEAPEHPEEMFSLFCRRNRFIKD